MALVKKAVETNTIVGTFEDVNEDSGSVVAEVDADVAEVATANPNVQDKVKVQATAVIAKAQNTAVGAVAKFQTSLTNFENALPAVDFGVLPRLKGSNGMVMDGDDAKLGDEIQITLISFNDQYVITPGVDEKEATKSVRYSLDGVTIDATGESVATYIQMLKDVEGFDKAEMKKYVELVGILNSSSKDSEHLGNMVQVSLSPQSRKSFEAYRLQKSVKIRMGKDKEEGAEELTLRAVVKSMGNYTFTILQVSDK